MHALCGRGERDAAYQQVARLVDIDVLPYLVRSSPSSV